MFEELAFYADLYSIVDTNGYLQFCFFEFLKTFIFYALCLFLGSKSQTFQKTGKNDPKLTQNEGKTTILKTLQKQN